VALDPRERSSLDASHQLLAALDALLRERELDSRADHLRKGRRPVSEKERHLESARHAAWEANTMLVGALEPADHELIASADAADEWWEELYGDGER
jgi:hypothetical protein